jgi:HEAT repeat protein
MGPLTIPYVTLFPLLLPIWQDRPLVYADLKPAPYPVVVADEQIALQREALVTADRGLRIVICAELRQTNLESAYAVLVRQLSVEADPGVLAVVLQQLEMSPFVSASLEAPVRPLLEHPNEDVRYWATALYGRLETAEGARLLKVVTEERSQAVRQVAAERLRDLPGAITLAAAYRPFRQDLNPAVPAALTVGACLAKEAAAVADELLRDLAVAHEAVRFAVAARLPDLTAPLPERLIPQLGRDASPSVRGETAAALGRLARPADLALLLALTRDPDPEVRRRALAACASYPGAETLTALVERLEDERTLVRRQAEDTLVGAEKAQPAGAVVTARLSRTAFPGRAHQCRVLGRIGFAESAAAVYACLRQETEPEGIRDAVFALGRFRHRPAAADIAAHSTHVSPVVRAAVAEALGYLAVPATYPALQALAFDPDEPVRQAALLAAGMTADGAAFSETVRQALVQTQPEKMSSTNRAAAAWAAGRLRPVAAELVKRLKVQATEAVVPSPMGPMSFEPDETLVCVDFALAQLAREDALAKTLFQEVLDFQQATLPPGAALALGGAHQSSKEVTEYAQQARAYLAGTPSTQRLRPTVSASFTVDRAQASP